MSQLALLFARQVLSKDSNIDEEQQVNSPAEVLVKAVEAIELRMPQDAWEDPEGRPLTQMILPHILYNLRMNFGAVLLFQKARNIAAKQWNGK